MTKEKHAGGRPVKYKTPELMQIEIDKYFDGIVEYNESHEDTKHPTVTGLAMSIDMTRKGLLEYCEKSDGFSNTIKTAKSIVEDYIEQRLYYGQATGCIFNLKNNFGWKDKTEQEISGDYKISGIDVKFVDVEDEESE